MEAEAKFTISDPEIYWRLQTTKNLVACCVVIR